MKASEFGGGDTADTHGIFPAPHQMSADEQLRMLYASSDALEREALESAAAAAKA